MCEFHDSNCNGLGDICGGQTNISILVLFFLTRFNKIAIQGTPQMAVD